MDIFKKVKINRKLKDIPVRHFSHVFPNWRGPGTMIIAGDQVHFNDLFVNFGDSGAIKKIFGKDTKKVLSKLDIGVYEGMGYMWIDNKGDRLRLMISRKYLLKGKKLYIYLDVVHELVHIKQHNKGIDLWNEKYSYLERPTEIEAYTTAAKEGKRLEMSTKALKSYLNAEWESNANNEKLYSKICETLNI